MLFIQISLIVILLAVLYVYIGYPFLLYVLQLLFFRKNPAPPEPQEYPTVTIVTAARNEAAVIKKTIENKLHLDYPADKLDYIIISDASDDGTDQIVQKFSGKKVRLIRQEPRQGKTAGLNRAIAQSNSDIIVIADANSIYKKDALKYLVARFRDPLVGYVTGQMVYVSDRDNPVGSGNSLYMKYENKLRELESATGSIVGVDGGIDAFRRELYQDMPVDALPDFYLPLTIFEQGYRVVYEPQAILYEESLKETTDEFKMRVRVSLRALHTLWAKRKLFNLKKYAFFALQLVSHKLFRYFAAVFQILIFILNFFLINTSEFWKIFFWLQCVFYLISIVVYFLAKREIPTGPFKFFLYFNLLNVASLVAIWRFLIGEKKVLWEPRKG